MPDDTLRYDGKAAENLVDPGSALVVSIFRAPGDQEWVVSEDLGAHHEPPVDSYRAAEHVVALIADRDPDLLGRVELDPEPGTFFAHATDPADAVALARACAATVAGPDPSLSRRAVMAAHRHLTGTTDDAYAAAVVAATLDGSDLSSPRPVDGLLATARALLPHLA